MDLELTRGDDKVLAIPGVPADTAWAAFTAKRSYADEDIAALLRKDTDAGVVIDEDGASITIAAADTQGLAAPVLLVWDLEVRSPAGLATTYAQGTLLLAADVTRDPGNAPGSGS